MASNPYQIRNAIRDERFFIGRARELQEIGALLNAPQPQSVAVIGDRRIGKSSLLQALYRACREHDANMVVAYQDVNGMHSSEEVLTVLADNLSVAGHVGSTPGPSPHTNLRRLISRLTKQSRVVLLLDEFDALTRQDAFPVTFFNFLRSLANEFPVALVLTAARKLKDICHSEEVAGSPFFNIFHERRLGSFSDAEARQLIEGPSRAIGRPLDEFTDAIIRHVGRLPLFLQIACYWLIEGLAAAETDPWKSAKVRIADDVLPHLHQLWRQLLPLERHALIEAANHRRAHDVPPATLDALRARGLLSGTVTDSHELAFELLAQFMSTAKLQEAPAPARTSQFPVFVSYCHRDAEFVERWGILETLQDLQSDGFVIFSDREMRTGDIWNDVLVGKLKESRILVALVTQEYLRSRYCQEVEIKAFWDGRVKEGMVIFPIIVGPCEWERHSWLTTTQFFPRKGSVMARKPVKRRELLLDVLKELRAIGQRMKH
jgi:hypothetical protein